MIALIIPQKTCSLLPLPLLIVHKSGFLVVHRGFVMMQTLILFSDSSSASPTKPATTDLYGDRNIGVLF